MIFEWLFCRHDYKPTGKLCTYIPYGTNVWTTTSEHKCIKCGKKVHIDIYGRKC